MRNTIAFFVSAATCGIVTGLAANRHTHENLHSTLWTQTSGEFNGTCRQAFALATVRLEDGLRDRNWTAALEQIESDYPAKPPAIICDVDETLLDNSPYQAWLATHEVEYTEETWKDWCRQAKAKPMPGAVEFIKSAHERGVTIFYVTNRANEVEPETRKNLTDAGFPIDEEKIKDVVLTKGEREWPSDKSTRREEVAKTHRILLLLGDDLNDFVSGARANNVTARRELAEKNASMWGAKWIVLPNQTYGSWVDAMFGRDFSLSDAQRLEKKYELLELYRPTIDVKNEGKS